MEEDTTFSTYFARTIHAAGIPLRRMTHYIPFVACYSMPLHITWNSLPALLVLLTPQFGYLPTTFVNHSSVGLCDLPLPPAAVRITARILNDQQPATASLLVIRIQRAVRRSITFR